MFCAHSILVRLNGVTCDHDTRRLRLFICSKYFSFILPYLSSRKFRLQRKTKLESSQRKVDLTKKMEYNNNSYSKNDFLVVRKILIRGISVRKNKANSEYVKFVADAVAFEKRTSKISGIAYRKFPVQLKIKLFFIQNYSLAYAVIRVHRKNDSSLLAKSLNTI